GAERVFHIMDEQPEGENEKEHEIFTLSGEVTYQNVSFSYEENQDTIQNVSFHVKPGQTVALVGPTGAGKTTIVSLLSRFYDAQDGDIRLDGINIKDISRSSLRSQMGVVLQDSILFETTVMENIRYGNLRASNEEVME